MNHYPVICFVGPSRCGKDEASVRLAARLGLRYLGATSTAILCQAATRLGIPADQAWQTRHMHRGLWRAIGDELRREDPAALVRAMRQAGAEVLNGIRALAEIQAARRDGLFDLVIWIDRPGLPPDPTLEFGPEACDLSLINWHGLEELYARVDRFADALRASLTPLTTEK